MTPRLAAAHHEAGHAIAAIRSRLKVFSIEVDDRGGGKCCHRRGPCGDSREERLQWISRQMQVAVAGQEGQRWVDPHGMHRSCSGDRSTLEEFKLMVEILTGDPALGEEMLADARQRAGKLINESWPIVEKIARKLDKRGRLSGDEIAELLDDGRPPRPSDGVGDNVGRRGWLFHPDVQA